MPLLLNARQEKFCQHLVEGMTADAAYQKAGYEANRGNPARLKGTESIAQRIAELEAQAAEKAAITKARVLTEWARLAFSNITETVQWDSNGVRLTPSDQLPPAVCASISEVVQAANANGTNIRVKLHGKTQALDALAKHFKLFDMSPEDPDEVARDIMAAVRQMQAMTHGGFDGYHPESNSAPEEETP